MTHDVERVFADIDADHGDRCVEFLRHGRLLVLSAPRQLLVLAGPEHGRTIPLTDSSSLASVNDHETIFNLNRRSLQSFPKQTPKCLASVSNGETEMTGFKVLSAGLPSVCVFDVNGSLLDVDSMAPF